MSNRRVKRRVFWGITFIVAALVIAADVIAICAGWIKDEYDLGIWKILLGLLCVIIAVWGPVHRKYWLPFPMLAALFLIFQNNIAMLFGAPEIKSISPWAVIAVAALLTAGSAVLSIRKKPAAEVNVGSSGSAQYKSGANIVYVDASDLGEGHEINNRLGAMEIFFSNIDGFPGSGRVIINNRMGAVTLHVPAGWQVANEISNQLGAVQNDVPTGTEGPILTVSGENNMGAIEIKADQTPDD